MSRIGRMPITVPAGVTVTIEAGNVVTAKGTKGTLTEKLHPAMKIENEAGVLHVIRPNDEKESKALHGLTRSLLANMVEGVSNGFSKTLEINGVGYRARLEIVDLEYLHARKLGGGRFAGIVHDLRHLYHAACALKHKVVKAVVVVAEFGIDLV